MGEIIVEVQKSLNDFQVFRKKSFKRLQTVTQCWAALRFCTREEETTGQEMIIRFKYFELMFSQISYILPILKSTKSKLMN